MRMRNSSFLSLALIAGLALAGCSAAEPSVTAPEPTVSEMSTATAVPESPIVEPEPVAVPEWAVAPIALVPNGSDWDTQVVDEFNVMLYSQQQGIAGLEAAANAFANAGWTDGRVEPVEGLDYLKAFYLEQNGQVISVTFNGSEEFQSIAFVLSQ